MIEKDNLLNNIFEDKISAAVLAVKKAIEASRCIATTNEGVYL